MNKKTNTKLSRRDFLKVSSLGSMSALAAPTLGKFGKLSADDLAYIKFLTPEGDPDSVAALRKHVEIFQNENPDIRIELQYTGPAQIFEKMLAGLTSGSGALDIVQPNTIVAYLLAAQGHLLPIDDVVEELGGEDNWYPDSMLKVDGNIYAAPYATEPYLIWYRKDLFDADNIAPPTDWESFEAAAKHFTKSFNPNSPTEFGLSLPLKIDKVTSWMASPFMWSNGAEWFDKDLNLAIDRPQTHEFLDWYSGLFQYVSESAPAYSWGDMINNFLTGQVAISMYSGRMLGRMYRSAPDLVGKAAVAVQNNKLHATWDDTNMLIISATTPYPEQCKKWLKYFYTGQATKDFLCSVPTHFVPAMKEQDEWWAQDVTGCTALDENPELKEAFAGTRSFVYNPMNNAGGIIEASEQGADQFVATGVSNPLFSVVQGGPAEQPLAEMLQEMVLNGKTSQEAMAMVLPGVEERLALTKEELGY